MANISDYITTMTGEVEGMGGIALDSSDNLRIDDLREECTLEELTRFRAKATAYSTVNVLFLEYDHMNFMKTRSRKMASQLGLDKKILSEPRKLLSDGMTEERQRNQEWTKLEYVAPVVQIAWNEKSFLKPPRSTALISDYYYYTFDPHHDPHYDAGRTPDPSKVVVKCQVSYTDTEKDEAVCDYIVKIETRTAKICNDNARELKEKVILMPRA